ncbi:elongation factor P maturation arginine rhamnosyltransferase EarP, partial [Pseudomonas aeruginosa]
LREAGLLERRRRFQASVSEQDEFLASLGVRRKVGERLISLFAYENPALPGWLEQLRDARQPSLLLVPEGRVLADVADWLRVATLAV